MSEDLDLTEKSLIWLIRISVGREQDWTGESGSWIGSSKSDLFASAAKKLLLTQGIHFDEAIEDSFVFASKDIEAVEDSFAFASKNINRLIKYTVIV